MGDVGSLALGGALGIIAVLLRRGVPAGDHGWRICGGKHCRSFCRSVPSSCADSAFSVWRRFTHHYELKGWPEPRVIVRFWIISLMLVLIGPRQR